MKRIIRFRVRNFLLLLLLLLRLLLPAFRVAFDSFFFFLVCFGSILFVVCRLRHYILLILKSFVPHPKRSHSRIRARNWDAHWLWIHVELDLRILKIEMSFFFRQLGRAIVCMCVCVYLVYSAPVRSCGPTVQRFVYCFIPLTKSFVFFLFLSFWIVLPMLLARTNFAIESASCFRHDGNNYCVCLALSLASPFLRFFYQPRTDPSRLMSFAIVHWARGKSGR